VVVIPAIFTVGVSKWCQYDHKFLWYHSSGNNFYNNLDRAKLACLEKDDCYGITQEPRYSNRYSLRKTVVLYDSPSAETTWVPCEGYFSCDEMGLLSPHGTFLSAHSDGSVDWDSSYYGRQERIKFEQFGKDTFFLRSVHGKYLSATPRSYLGWNRGHRRSWELFKISQDEDKIALKSWHGKYLSAQSDGTVDVDRHGAYSWEWFTVYPPGCLNKECDCTKSMDKAKYVLEDIEYFVEKASVHEYPPETVAYLRIDNTNGTAEQNIKFVVSETVSDSSSFTHTAGASVTVGTEFSVGVPLLSDGKVSVEISAKYEFAYGKERVEESATEAEYTCIAPVGKKVKCSALLFKYQSSVPYKQSWTHKQLPCPCESSGVFSQIAAHEMQLVITEE